MRLSGQFRPVARVPVDGIQALHVSKKLPETERSRSCMSYQSSRCLPLSQTAAFVFSAWYFEAHHSACSGLQGIQSKRRPCLDGKLSGCMGKNKGPCAPHWPPRPGRDPRPPRAQPSSVILPPCNKLLTTRLRDESAVSHYKWHSNLTETTHLSANGTRVLEGALCPNRMPLIPDNPL